MILHVLHSLRPKLLQVNEMHILLLLRTLMPMTLLQMVLQLNALIQQLLSSHLVLLLLHLHLVITVPLVASRLWVCSLLFLVVGGFLLVVFVHNADLCSLWSTLSHPLIIIDFVIWHNHLWLIVPVSITLSFSFSLPIDIIAVISWRRSRRRMASLMMSTTFFHVDDGSSLFVWALKLDWLSSALWFGMTSAFLLWSLIIHISISSIMVATHVHRIVGIIGGALRIWILIHGLHFQLLMLLLEGFIRAVFISVILGLVVAILYSFIATAAAALFVPLIMTLSRLMVALPPLRRLLILLGVRIAFLIFASWWVSQAFTIYLVSISVFVGYGRSISFWLSTGLPCWLIFQIWFDFGHFYCSPFFTLLAQYFILACCICGLKLRTLWFFILFYQILQITGMRWVLLVIWTILLAIMLW